MKRVAFNMPGSLTIEPKPSKSTNVLLRRTTINVIGFAFLLSLQAKTTIAGCPRALGMEDKRIPDGSIKASSAYGFYEAFNGRLNKVWTNAGAGGWLARSNTDPWFEVDFGSKVTISKIATQGHNDYKAWVMTYAISHRSGNGSFILYNSNQNFQGNWDQNTIVVNVFKPVIFNRVIRIIPKTWYYLPYTPALRAEFYGCRRVSQGNMTGTAISAESIHVVWQFLRNIKDNSLPCGFKVAYRAATRNNESWIVEKVTISTTQHTIRDLLAYTTYVIQVEALNDACSGTFSPAVKVTTNEKAPSAPPQNVTAVAVTYFSVALKWLPPPKNKWNGRILQYSVTAWQIVSLSNISATEAPAISGNYSHDNTSSEQQGLFPGLRSDTNYKIIIIASNSAGNSPPSFPVHFITLKVKDLTMPSTSQKNTEDVLFSTQEPTSIPTIFNEKQKDEETASKNNIVIGLAVAAAVALFSVILIGAYVFYRRKKRGGDVPEETMGGSIYNNRVTASQARHLPNKEDTDLYLVPVDNHKRWQQQQQYIKTSTDHSYYNSEEIMLQKQSNLSQMSNLCDDDYSYAAPVDLRSTSNRNEDEISPQFVQHNPVYETSEGVESQDKKIGCETLHDIQGNPIYTAVTDQISFSKQTKNKLTKKPVPAKRNKTTITKPDSPHALMGHRESSKIEVPLQSEPDYQVLDEPDPSTPDGLNNASANIYDVLYSTDSRDNSEGEALSGYDVICSSSNKPQPDTRSKHKPQKTPTRQTAVDTPDLYEKLWLSSTDDEPQQRIVDDNSCNNIYDIVGDSIA